MIVNRIIISKKDLELYGLNADQYKEMKNGESIPEEIQTLKVYRCEIGGASVNTFKILSQKSNIQLKFIGAVGDDENAIKIIEFFKHIKINYHIEIINHKDTAKCFALVCNNQRNLFTDLGASRNLSEKFFHENFIFDGEKDLLYIHGFFICAVPIIAKILLNFIDGDKLIFNLSSSEVFDSDKLQILLNFFNIAKYVVGNKKEFIALHKKLFDSDYEEEKEIIIRLSQKNKVIICTDGKEKIMYSESGRYGEEKVDLIDEDNLDTCGAGDAFAAGFLHSLNYKKSIKKCINNGIKWAKETIVENTKIMKGLKSF